jgi:hypothetical protein
MAHILMTCALTESLAKDIILPTDLGNPCEGNFWFFSAQRSGVKHFVHMHCVI